jgi:thymidylate synthase (FAD)
MTITKPDYAILYPQDTPDWKRELQFIELAGRTAYKSEDKITDESASIFVKNIVTRGHLAVIEFGNMIVKFITDRGITHELVRHRVCSFVQESTRYCNYGKGKFGRHITIIRPTAYDQWSSEDRSAFIEGCLKAARNYIDFIDRGHSPQEARAILPNAVKGRDSSEGKLS